MASSKSGAKSQARKDYEKRVAAQKRALEKEYRHGLKVLKDKGLYSGDVRKAKLGWRQRNLVNTLKDVIAGKSAAVPIPKEARKAVNVPNFKAAKGGLRRKGNRLIAPVRPGEEKLHFDKRTNTLVSTVEMYGAKFKRMVLPGTYTSVKDLSRHKKGEPKFQYGLISPRHSLRFETKAELRKFLAEYKRSKTTSAKDHERYMMQFIEVIQPLDDARGHSKGWDYDEEADEDEDEDEGDEE